MRKIALLCLLLFVPLVLSVTNKDVYHIGEPVLISAPENARIIINAPEAKYRLLDPFSTTVPFVPKTAGEYTVNLIDSTGRQIDSGAFTVLPGVQDAISLTITVSEQPTVGENVAIYLDPVPTNDIKIIINTPTGTFKYFGPWKDTSFVPKTAGEHEVIVTENDETIGRHIFTVEDGKTLLPVVETPIINNTNFTFMMNSKGVVREFTTQILQYKDRQDLDIRPAMKAVHSLRIRDVKAMQDPEIGLDDLPATIVDVGVSPVLQAYAVDLGKFNFTNATLTSTAVGNTLYKCATWNFTTRECPGGWEKHLDLVPGQSYNVYLYPGDPGFAEVNLTILNIQSFPTVGGNWVVEFNTTGTANLTIQASNGTTWTNGTVTDEDLQFLEVACGNQTQNYQWINGVVFIENYSCSQIGRETSKVFTTGKHTIQFTFGDITKYAFNDASDENYFYNESDGNSASTSTSPVNKTTLQFTTGAIANYTILATAEMSGSATDSDISAQLTIDDTIEALYTSEPDETGIFHHYFIAHKTTELAAGTHNLALQHFTESGQTSTIRNARIIVLKARGALYNETDAEQSVGTTATDVVNLTFTVATSGEYLLIGSAEGEAGNTGASITVRTLFNGGEMAESIFESQDLADYKPHFTANVTTLSAGTHNIAVQAQAETGTMNVRRARVTAIPTGNNFETFSVANETETTSDPEVNKTILTFTPTVQDDYLIMSMAVLGGDASNGPTLNAFTETLIDGTEVGAAQFGIQDDTDRHALLTIKNTSFDTSEHDVYREYSSGSAAAPDASLGSSRIIVLRATVPPTISDVQCFELGVGWDACSNIQFGDVLDAVRGNCTPGGTSVSNVTFSLQNVEDTTVFFTNTTTDNGTGRWFINISDVTIADSGTFRLTTTCVENPTVQDTTEWQVPWGTLNATLITPNSNTNVVRNAFFNWTSRVTCTGGECGDVNATLDPIDNNITLIYNSSGVFNVPADVTMVEVLVVAGGGGGGAYRGGGGGSGGVLYNASYDISSFGSVINVTVGVGGGGGSAAAGSAGGNSSFGNLTAVGGGGGGLGTNGGNGGVDGGSGGGAGGADTGGSQAPGSGTVGQGNDGGDSFDSGSADPRAGGGGGGAGAVGGNAASDVGGDGGIGENYSATFGTGIGENGMFAGGGGGGTNDAGDTQGTGGLGGGGDANSGGNAEDAMNGTGGGGGGAGGGFGSSNVGGDGGDGLVIIRYNSSIKGVVPMHAGTPFYTINANTMFPANTSCLGNMTNTSTCDTTWSVNATGSVNTTWTFFVSYGAINYSANISEVESTNINITILDIIPPEVNTPRCFKIGAGWVVCDELQFGDTLHAVRANCTAAETNISNVTFELQNVEDGTVFFNNFTTDNSTGFWVSNVSDITINDSGTFRLTTTCFEDGVPGIDVKEWQVPWGTLNATLITPTVNINVTQNLFFNWTSRVTCTGGECGDVNATLDPPNVTVVYNLTGASTFIVPRGVTTITVKIWGAGGGGGGAHTTNAGGDGGGGGYSEANLTVTPGETLDIFVGGGGGGGNGTLGSFVTGEGGGGGGSTFINRSTTTLLLGGAGGGGGGGDNSASGVGEGGVGGNNTAGDGGDASAGTDGGSGGDQTSGGSGGGGANAGTAGGNLTGGEGGDSGGGGQGTGDANNGGIGGGGDGGTVEAENFAGGGGGGAGYRGGGGGGSSTSGEAGGGGGAGGSNFITGTLIANQSGSGTSPPNTGDVDYQTGAGTGGAGGTGGGDGSDGGNGLLVITYISKGIIPMHAGTPFYTITANTMLAANNSCLANMTNATFCDTTWEVNATGEINSTWEFFAIYEAQNYSANISSVQTASINITIIGNEPPYVINVSLTPTQPTFSSDLNCSFTVIDQNPDSLTANVTWYNSSTIILSEEVSVTSGVQAFAILGSGNTSVDDVWWCGVQPHDSLQFGFQENSSNVTVLISQPPIVNPIQCQENGSTWGECANIVFSDTLSAVRVNCTDPDGHVLNATFNFTNIDDSNTFFFNTTTENTTGFFVFNNTDIQINDSGTFNLTVSCEDNSTVIGSNNSQWFLPWGHINVSISTPPDNSSVTQNVFFNFTTQISCIGGECGDIFINSLHSFENVTGFNTTNNLLTNPGAETGDETGWSEGAQGFIVDDETDFTTITPQSGSWMFVAGPGSGTHTHIGYQVVDVSNYSTDIDNGLVIVNTTAWLAAQADDTQNVTVHYLNSSGDILVTYTTGGDDGETWEQFNNFTTAPTGTRRINFTWGTTSTGSYADSAMDDTNLTVRFPLKDVLMKIVDTTAGTTPFYTTSSQPQTCNLAGNVCTLTWEINTTGSIGTSYLMGANATSNLSQVIGNSSSNITVHIAQNAVPNVTAISLTPVLATTNNNLTCTFTVHDDNTLDILTANVTWYQDGAYYNSSVVSVTNDVSTNVVLESGNTNISETWWCGVQPFDQIVFGNQVNSSNVTILSTLPPVINVFECLENNSLWTGCTNLVFGDTFSGVRINCTAEETIVQNVTFNFTNIPDNNVFFDTVTTLNDTDLWYYFENITMNDSGEFEIFAGCTDNASVTATTLINWTLPWGQLVSILISPDSDTSVQKDGFFTFTSRVDCIIGECGNVNATLDPGFAPPSPSNGTPDGGSIFDEAGNDEEGGSFLDAQSNDGNFYAMGEDDDGEADSTMNLTFNLTALGISPVDITNLTLTLTYCHSGEDTFAAVDCNGDDPSEKTFTGGQDVWFYNTRTGIFDSRGTLDTTNGESEVTDIYMPTSNFEDYMGSDNFTTIRVEIFTAGGAGDSWLAIEHAVLTVSFEVIKHGKVSTTVGALPFYTTDSNPQDFSDQACLASLIRGDMCTTTWQVNATGAVNTTHEFFVEYNLTTNLANVNDSDTAHIDITIVDENQVPPLVFHAAPPNNTFTNNPNIAFNCSATDNNGLANLTLYGDFSGTWQANGTNNVSGTSNTTLYNRTLQEGVFLWSCLGFDINGNPDWSNGNRTITVDTSTPNVSLFYPSDGENFFLGTVEFSFNVTDNIDAVLVCNITIDDVVVDQAFNANNASNTTRTITSIDQGTHFWNITCVDDANNFNISETRNFTVVDLPPNVTLITPNGTSRASSTIDLDYNATDNNNVTIARLILDGVINATQGNPDEGVVETFTVLGLQEGLHNWTVNVSDVTNLTAQAPIRYFFIDFTAPTINLSAPDNNFVTNSSTVIFNFTAIDNLDSSLTCNITINGTDVDTNISATNGSVTSRTVNNIADGVNIWNVTCVDDSGNSNVSETRTFNVSAPPTVELNSPADNFSQSSSDITLIYTPTDNTGLALCQLYVNDAANQTNSTALTNGAQNNFTLTGLGEGFYNWTVECSDLGGRNTTATPIRNFIIDAQPPNITLHNPLQNETIFANTVNFNFTVIDAVDTIMDCNLTIDGNVNASITAANGTPTNYTVAFGSDGTYFWNVTCIDDAGNSNTSETRNFTLSIPPAVTLNLPIDNDILASGTNVNFSYLAFDSDGIANASLIINGEINQTDTSVSNENINWFLANLTDGVYTWTVNATDNNGLEATATPRTVTIDTTPPLVSYVSPIEGSVQTWNNVSFTFNVTDNLDSSLFCNVTIDGTTQFVNLTVANASEETNYFVLGDGAHNWSVSCIDHANHTNGFVLINFTVDAPPNITLNFPINRYRDTLVNITFNYTPEDPVSIDNCTLYVNGILNQTDGNVEHNEDNFFNVTGLGDGEYNWTVTCFDIDANSATPANETFYVDLTGPVIVLNNPPEGGTLNNNSVLFNWTPTDFNTSTPLICNLTLDDVVNQTGITGNSHSDFTFVITNLTDGSHNWSVTCVDDLGNYGFSSVGNFTINQPDMLLTDARVSFTNLNPDEGEEINITANVSNIGGIAANDVNVSFWDGGQGGTFLGYDTGSIAINSSRIFTIPWNITQGFHNIFVSVDPIDVIQELNETNNNASANISFINISITDPANNTLTSDTTPQLTFNISDYTDNNLTFRLYVDGTLNGQEGTVTDKESRAFNLSALADGTHIIIIQANDTLGRFKNSTEFTIRIDTTAPSVDFLTLNGTWHANNNVSVEFNITDTFSTTLNYSVFLDGIFNHSNITTNGAFNFVNFTGVEEGIHRVIIQATDELNNTANNTEFTFIVDLTPPEPNITTANNTWFSDSTPDIDFLIIDNLDDVLNWTLFVDGEINVSGTANNDTTSSGTLTTLTEGVHVVILQALDEARNLANSTEVTINIDFTPPNVTLLSPANDTNISSTSVTLNFTVNDNLAVALICNLTLDGTVVSQNVIVNNDSFHNFTVGNLNSGFHHWNATCLDNASNQGISQTWRFFVELADIEVNAGNITFSNSTPIENQTVIVNATIFNIGNLNATNVTVQFFLGHPDLGGVQINGNITIPSLGTGGNATVGVNHSAVIGLNQIYVVVDPPLATNGSIAEENESNNIANRNFNVGHFQIFAGTSDNELQIADTTITAAFTWNQTEVNGSNVFVADSDSSIVFTALQAIGRNTTNGTAVGNNDFEEIDVELNATALNDSVNLTWTVGGSPRAVNTLPSFKRTIQNVPVVNSTNTSSFFTGILWDTSDTGNFYNGSQDVVFVTTMNESRLGQFGTYDYEIKIPATLRDYITGGGTITFYTELR